ncbi:hypothetical protein MED121_06725 [Marinomonas sp. MED121]|nr:hypothetical protein MED121_06725 [Marinomonas sp. MED121]
MWFKVLSLMILCLLSLSAQASPFGHANALNSEDVQLSSDRTFNPLYSQAFLETECRKSQTISAKLECCHIDTCSALMLDLEKNTGLPLLSDSQTIFIHWPDTPLSRLIRPPKVSFV